MRETNRFRSFHLRPLTGEDRAWVEAFSAEHWGSDKMVVHSEIFTISSLPEFAAEIDGAIGGLVTYHISYEECEILSLDSLQPGIGIGTALIEAVRLSAIQQGCRQLSKTP